MTPAADVRRAALAFAVLAVLYQVLASSSPVSAGVWGDDGVYLATARSLARGDGYRHPEIPGAPYQTKYPVLYPALLSLGFRLAPDFPDNFALLLLPNAVAAAGLVALALLYLRGVFGASLRLAWTAAALTAISPALLAFVRYAMSDLVFAFLATASLLCLDHLAPGAARARSARAWLLAGALLAGLAALTRTLGLPLAVAAVAVPLARRRPADAALAAAAVASCVAPWLVWQAAAAAQNGPLQGQHLVGADLDYGLWLPGALPDALRVAWRNLFGLAFGLGYFQLALPGGWVRAAFSGSAAKSALVHAVCWTALAAVLFGFVRSARAGVRTLHVYALLYGAVLLVWPHAPYRFLVPWTPFLLYFLLDGLSAAAAAVGRRFGGRGERARNAAFAAVLALVAALFLGELQRITGSSDADYYLRETPFDAAELRALEAWTRENTPERAVIASFRPARIFLTTGRQGANFWTDADPLLLSYGRNRRWTTFYAVPEADAEPFYRDMRERLAPVYRELGITHYAAYAHAPQTPDMARLIRERPRWFRERYATPRGTYRVYELALP